MLRPLRWNRRTRSDSAGVRLQRGREGLRAVSSGPGAPKVPVLGCGEPSHWLRGSATVVGVVRELALETDYLVVGSGALGMAFVDSLLEHSDADVVMIDRRHCPGGHWLDAYPFVRLHQPSRYYGVDSTTLGQDRIERDGADAGWYERASGAEICAYYDEIMSHRFLASGRVRFFPMSNYSGDRRFTSLVTGTVTNVVVRRAVVDATYFATRVPATDPPPFEVAEGTRCVPVGELAWLADAPAGFVILGGGKTAMDAICWLLDRGCDPQAITWIRPRDNWLLNRDFFQPGRARTLAGVVALLEAMVAASSVDATYLLLEEAGVMLRTNTAVAPTMMKGATVSGHEVEQLRRVEDVVRLGHVERIDTDRIVLEQGSVPTTPDHLHVHCATQGLADNPLRPIFTDDTITLQLVTRMSLSLSGALLGVVESSGRTTEDKNRLCPPTAWPHTPFDYLRVILAGINAESGWFDAPDLQEFVDASRLNLLSGLGAADDAEDITALQTRLFTAIGPAFEKLRAFAETATPRERARSFQ
jgi:hypothetical protein